MNQVPTQAKQKNKWLAFLLAVILGPLGFHNFYLSRWKRGFFQFFLVFLTFSLGLLVTIPWAWTEAFLILIGKYSMGPKKVHQVNHDQPSSDSEVRVVSPLKEYFITSILLCSLLIGSIPLVGVPIIFAILFYFLVGGLWNKVTRLFIKTVLPIYATVFSSGKKFLIRFSEYQMPRVETRAELFKATRKLSFTAILVLLFATSIIAQSNVSMIAEGDIPTAVMCDDGTYKTDAVYCDDESSGTPCDSACVLENIGAGDRIEEAYFNTSTILIFMFAPFVTIFVAPILVLRYSSLSIVDKKTRSMSPIGEKASGYTNVIMGAGSVVLFFQTALNIARASTDSGDFVQSLQYIGFILFLTLFLVLFFYPLVWLPMLKFTKSFESHVLLLDDSLVKSKGIEIHNLTYENNELRISPVKKESLNVDNSIYPNTKIEEQHKPLIKTVESIIPPHASAIAQKTDQHGYEWFTTVDGKSWYRIQGTTEEWIEFTN